MAASTISLFLAGDVMTGRGVDQILPHPGDPDLRERSITDARGYVSLAELHTGPIPLPVSEAWPWGEALEVLDTARPDLRIVNLETSVTRSNDFAPGKGVHYRMTPENLGVLTAARIDACTLANNHVLDFGTSGLEETLDVLHGAGIRTAGAGRYADAAWAPAALRAPGGRVWVWSVALESSGVQPRQAAGPGRPGVAFLPDLSSTTAVALLERIHAFSEPTDLSVVSIHWGSNWGYEVPEDEVRFAHQLVDGGVGIVYGHSSHHPRPLEVYHGAPVLYGCGDLINDYEGISGHAGYHDELRVLYLVTIGTPLHALRELRLVPMRSERMRLLRAGAEDGEWVRNRLNLTSRQFGTHLRTADDGGLVVDLGV